MWGGSVGSGDPSGTGHNWLQDSGDHKSKGISCLCVKSHAWGGSALPQWLLETKRGLNFLEKQESANHWANWLLPATGRNGAAVCTRTGAVCAPGPFLLHPAGPTRSRRPSIPSRHREQRSYIYSNSKITIILVPLWYTRHIPSYAEHR